MKILHIIGSLDKRAGGPSRSVPQTCIELAKSGLEIEIIARPSENPVDVPQTDNLTVRFLTLSQLIGFARSIDRTSVSLVHLQHVWDPYIAVMARAARRAKIPYVITPRGMLEPWIMNRNRWKKQLALVLYQRHDLQQAALLHATCDMEKHNIEALELKNPIAVVPNGLDLSEVPPSKQHIGSRKVVFLSRIHPKKGLELLLDAWKQLRPTDWTLEIAGDGDTAYQNQLLEKTTREAIRGVHFVGPRYGQAKWDFIKSADLFVLPTYSENFGIVVAEALAVGVPVITTTGTPWQELHTCQCGWWIDLSVAELAKTLQTAMQTDRTELAAMGKRGRQLVIARFDIGHVSNTIRSFYESIMQSR